jgi:hypothetical protein
MVEKFWFELENKYENVKIHEFTVMPNYFHGILEIINDRVKYDCENCNVGCEKCNVGCENFNATGRTHRCAPTGNNQNTIVGADLCVCPVYNFKSALSIILNLLSIYSEIFSK